MLSSEFIRLAVICAVCAHVVVQEIIILGGALFNRSNRSARFPVSRRCWGYHILSILGIGSLCWAYFVEPYRLETSMITIQSKYLQHARLRIVHLSDTHCEAQTRNETELITIVNGLKPDVITFTGDALNTPAALENFQTTMRSLEAGIAKVAVSGNWDFYYRDKDLWQGTGFRSLHDECIEYTKEGERFYIGGLAYDSKLTVNEVFREVGEDTFTLFLYHTPDLIGDVAGNRPDLYLAGHTHGGQIALPWFGALVTFSKCGKTYESGFHRVMQTALYVSRGIGMEGGVPPLRFFARPEIVVIDIMPQE